MVQYIIFVTVYKENPFPNNYVIRKEKSISIAFTDHCGEFSLVLYQNLKAVVEGLVITHFYKLFIFWYLKTHWSTLYFE